MAFNHTFNPENINIFATRRHERFASENNNKYHDALKRLPMKRNCGNNVHLYLKHPLANLAVRAGVSLEQFHKDVSATGQKLEAMNEDAEAYRNAEYDYHNKTVSRSCKPSGFTKFQKQFNAFNDQDRQRAIERVRSIIRKGGVADIEMNTLEHELWESSSPHPESIPRCGGLDGAECCADMILFLRELYQPEDCLYIGLPKMCKEKQPACIKTAAEWISFFSAKLEEILNEPNEREQFYLLRHLSANYPLIIPNPVSGEPLNGSYRSDNNIVDFRYIVVEADDFSLAEQISLIQGWEFPVVAMTYSGGKSIHALLDASAINCGNPIKSIEEWKEVVGSFYGKIAPTIFDKELNKRIPISFDPQDKNASRFSRLPGLMRDETGKFQKLLYINRAGGKLCLMK